MGSLSRSLFETSLLGTDCLVAGGDLVSGGVGGFHRAKILNCSLMIPEALTSLPATVSLLFLML